MKSNAQGMKRTWAGLLAAALALSALALPAPAAAQAIPHMPTGGMMDWGTEYFLLFDQLEYVPGGAGRPVGLDATGWYGGAYNRVWFRAEGEQLTAESIGDAEAQVLYGRLIAPFWDALVGVRVDTRWVDGSATRGLLAAGIQGLAPYWFELAPTLFVSQNGDLSARLEAEYEILLTQRAVLTPELELNAALQEVEEWGVGSGLNDYELGLRLRYEIRREFAPYVGWVWARRLGDTADLARAEGEEVSGDGFVTGLRVWF
jgi:copper resistance protein B